MNLLKWLVKWTLNVIFAIFIAITLAKYFDIVLAALALWCLHELNVKPPTSARLKFNNPRIHRAR